MSTITIIMQTIGILLLYSLMVYAVPAYIFRDKLNNRRLCERFMILSVFGNFYIVNIVFLLQLLHISNRYTLIAFTLILFLVLAYYKKFDTLKMALCTILDIIGRLVRGTLGVKTFIRNIVGGMRIRLGLYIARLFEYIRHNGLETALFVVMIILMYYVYGINSLVYYGYSASDIAVHNLWINEMSNNNVFSAGVYPHGFHCVIYFMHEVFGIHNYILLRLFTFSNVLIVMLNLFCFIRYMTKSRYSAYAAMIIYIASNLINRNCYIRFTNNLPQEFGMAFIFPTIYFIFSYFTNERLDRVRAKWFDVVGAAASFSLAIAVHFYGAMIVGIFCIAIVIGYINKIFRPRYFAKIMAAFMLGVILAALPMGVALAQGKGFQGSIGWGLSVMNSTPKAEDNSSSDKNTSDSVEAGGEADGQEKDEDKDSSQLAETEKLSIPEAAAAYIKDKYIRLANAMILAIINRYGKLFLDLFLGSTLFLIIWGMVSNKVLQEKVIADYGQRIISLSLGAFLIMLMLISTALGIPPLMDLNRGRIYFVYSVVVILSLMLDVIPVVLAGRRVRQAIINPVSCAIASICLAVIFIFGGIRKPAVIDKASYMITNGAVYCLDKIINSHEKESYTIVSSGEELRMMEGYGFHEEIVEFLIKLKSGEKFTLPSRYVYYFIEKVPIDNMSGSNYVPREVSTAGAARVLGYRYPGNSVYKSENRYMLMSKMYYWALAYKEIYPEDFTVYYEDDEFICYRLVQNTSFLNNQWIDYRYNK